MKMFSELYGKYFKIAEKLLAKEKVSENDVYKIVQNDGFKDSSLFLPQKLIPQKDGSDWGLLKKNDDDGNFMPVIKNAPVAVLTKIQKMWLKAKLQESKIGLFLDDKEIKMLEKQLEDVEPLYNINDFRFIDMFSDGDDFSDLNYKKHFKAVLTAVKSQEVLEICFTSGHGKKVCAKYLPIKIEYSQKNDKFRVLCYTVKKGRIRGEATLNIGRIEEIERTGIYFKEKIELVRKNREYVTVSVSNGRNGVERFMTEFAGYEKRTEREIKTGKCIVKLYYDKHDETELLIGLLSFGEVIEILEPKEFREQAAERVKKQWELLERENM